MVALLAEGVDRKQNLMGQNDSTFVALLAEGVDRKLLNPTVVERSFSRPPRGGRG